MVPPAAPTLQKSAHSVFPPRAGSQAPSTKTPVTAGEFGLREPRCGERSSRPSPGDRPWEGAAWAGGGPCARPGREGQTPTASSAARLPRSDPPPSALPDPAEALRRPQGARTQEAAEPRGSVRADPPEGPHGRLSPAADRQACGLYPTEQRGAHARPGGGDARPGPGQAPAARGTCRLGASGGRSRVLGRHRARGRRRDTVFSFLGVFCLFLVTGHGKTRGQRV